MPLYKQEVHDEVLRRLEELGVDVVLGERLTLPEDKLGEMKRVVTSTGKVIEYDLLVSPTPLYSLLILCTEEEFT